MYNTAQWFNYNSKKVKIVLKIVSTFADIPVNAYDLTNLYISHKLLRPPPLPTLSPQWNTLLTNNRPLLYLALYIFSALTDSKLWVLDRRVFQAIMMKTGIERQEENIRYLRRYRKGIPGGGRSDGNENELKHRYRNHFCFPKLLKI